MLFLLPIIAAYLLGAIPFGYIVPRFYGIDDIRKHGSGNVGATNVARILGFKAAIWVYFGDISKGILAVLIGRWFVNGYELYYFSIDAFLLICVLAAMLGHIFPLYLKFNGGKGVNTVLGGMIALLPLEALLALVVFGIVVTISKYISLGSMLASITFFLIIIGERFLMHKDIAMIYIYISGLIVLLILITHRQNIVRIFTGKESKVTSKSKPHQEGSHV